MEIDELNVLIADHLRHYGLRVVARCVEDEVKRHNFNSFKQPSTLLMKIRQVTGFRGSYATGETQMSPLKLSHVM
jgi:hypothetical protein